jgi:YVTN family beta-propeller protein
MAIEIHGSHRLRVFKMLTTVSVGHTNDCSRKVPSLWCLTLLLAGLTVGVFPQGALALETVYATVRNQRSVRVINPTTNTFIGSPIAVGGGPREAVASPDGSRVYVVNSSNTTRDISVIETSTNTVTATIFVVFQPKDMVIAPDGKRGYVTVWGGASGLTPGSHIKVIDTDPCSSSYHAILDSISLSADLGVSTSLTITALAISPDGRLLYLTGSDKVFVMDTSANTLDDTFVLSGGSAQDIGISPDGSRLFVTHDSLTFGKVSAIDLATSSINPINVGGGLRGLAVTPDGSRVYAVDLGKFHVINTATDTFVTVFPGASRLEKVAFNSDGSRAYITVSNQYWVIVIDTDPGSGTYHTKLSTIAFGDSVIPHGITVASGGLGGPLPEAVCCQDADEDGYGQFGGPSCSNPGTDCDDGNADVYPGAVELCDGGDNDCNGQTDDGVAGVGEACNTGLPGVYPAPRARIL